MIFTETVTDLHAQRTMIKKHLFFSVPDEPGWDLRIDGSVVEHIRVCGLILLKVQGGRHFVEFSYHTPGLKTGVIISVLSWMVFLFLFWRYYTGTVQK